MTVEERNKLLDIMDLIPDNETLAVRYSSEENGPISHVITYEIGLRRVYKLYKIVNNKLTFTGKSATDPFELEVYIQKSTN